MAISIHCKYLPVAAMALYPFILYRRSYSKYDEILTNHELIHHRQQLELGILPFYIIYAVMYLYHLVLLQNHHRAYLAIAFEREAFLHQADLTYLKNRKWISWWGFNAKKNEGLGD